MRPYADNVWLRLLPLEKTTASGLVLVEGARKQRGTRRAYVMASGPGYRAKSGVLVENEVRTGDTVYVDALAGQDWSMDFDPPRHNPKIEFDQHAGERGEYRVIRSAEIQAVERDGRVVALGENIIVRRTEAAKMTPGGLHIPDDAAPKPITGIVVSVGAGRARDDGKIYPLGVRAGETVLFGKWQGTEIEIAGESLLVLREDHVLGVTEDNAAVEAA